MRSGSNLEKVLEAGHFAVTCELGPPKGADGEEVRELARLLKGNVDAANVTDNQTAVVRMSSIGAARLMLDEGLEPVMQMVTRDRNRIAIQSDILGAAAMGIKNVLCLTGDHQSLGNNPQAKSVWDIDSLQQLAMLKAMRDEGVDAVGEELKGSPEIFLGAAANPFGDPTSFRVTRLAKKINAGADFIQTQVIYDVARYEEWMEEARDRGLLDKVHVMGGIVPLKSAGAAKYMQKMVAGIYVPDEVVKRMKAAEKGKKEGRKIALELIEQLRTVKGNHGVHIMAIMWEKLIPKLTEEAGLLPRPKV
ncbi:MAG: methylenetetrahydrofolate reductase [Thermoplasmata archaeon]|nr:methylenetetrahydrofolate reductase [Thermoplasmata archaeon]